MKWHGTLFYVRDLETSIAFYSGALGLPVMARPAPHMAIIGLDNGLLYLHEDPDDAPDWLKKALEPKVRGVGVIGHIEVDDVNDVRDKLVAAGFAVPEEPVETHGQMQLYVYDPSGHNVVFVQPVDGASDD